MKEESMLKQGRYLLYLDILGFEELVKTTSAQDIYAVVEGALEQFARWEEVNGLFKTILFSDTFIFYQRQSGYGDWAFLDIYAIGGMVLSSLLAVGIPARGAISFGEFEVSTDKTDRHQIYFGKALIETYKSEAKENWIGITILPSAWKPYEEANPGTIDTFASEKVWSKRKDDEVLLLNPFIKLRGWYTTAQIDDYKPYSKWDAPEFPNDIRGVQFLRQTAAAYADRSDFTSDIAIKYHTTIRFLESIMEKDLYAWGQQAAVPENFGSSAQSAGQRVPSANDAQ